MNCDYQQIVVWHECCLGESSAEDFEKFILDKLGARCKFLEQVTTLPDVIDGKVQKDTGGRYDILFAVHKDDVPSFAVKRFAYKMRWWEDVLDNMINKVDVPIYSDEVLEKYPYGWKDNDLGWCDYCKKIGAFDRFVKH